MDTFDQREVRKGDLMISHRKNYHYLVERIEGNKLTLLWLHRRTGEPAPLSTYRREIKLDRAPSDYDIFPAKQVDWSNYSNL